MNQPQNYALYALEKARILINRHFRSKAFVTLSILTTAIASFSAVSLLETLTYSGITLTILEKIIPFSATSLFGAVVLYTLLQVGMWSVSAIGAWQLYTAKAEKEWLMGWKRFKFFSILITAESAITAIISFITATVCLITPTSFAEEATVATLMPIIITCIIIAAFSIVFVLIPFYGLVQYLSALQSTFATGIAPYEKLPFAGILIYGIFMGIVSLWTLSLLNTLETTPGLLPVIQILLSPIFHILLPFFLKRLHSELSEI